MKAKMLQRRLRGAAAQRQLDSMCDRRRQEQIKEAESARGAALGAGEETKQKMSTHKHNQGQERERERRDF